MPDWFRSDLEVVSIQCRTGEHLGDLEAKVRLDAVLEQPEPVIESHLDNKARGTLW